MHAMDNTTEKRTIQKKNRNYNNTDIYFIFKKQHMQLHVLQTQTQRTQTVHHT